MNDGAADLETLTPLPRSFYARPTEQVAPDLLGKWLIHETDEGLAAGQIVEAEAYLSENDSSCHAARGLTRSNAAMFGPPGHAYVYPIHSRYCFNVVTGKDQQGTAALIRAVRPTAGEALMRIRRGRDKLLDLCRGPARLCEALAINRDQDHWDLTQRDCLWLAEPPEPLSPDAIGVSPRIGVTSAKELPLRFFVIDSPFVSGKRSLSTRRPKE